ncbi:M23 family metallopeptidase [Ruania halotolerans]|uniref:M23 family metallopeptidase n=1 Tax=Ruania halotolerans TaxID=2897773 RepID=UPI001E502538|nr:M23 family metallopeptidase [Ruania halotolerans]UFU05200.1 M23 family metallopeptidase [Ruania halotolerans]
MHPEGHVSGPRRHRNSRRGGRAGLGALMLSVVLCLGAALPGSAISLTERTASTSDQPVMDVHTTGSPWINDPRPADPRVPEQGATEPGHTSFHRWPLDPIPSDPWAAISRGFERPPAPWAAGHRGVDIPAQPGDPVFASAAGVVAFSGIVVDRPVLSVDHPGGLRTTYEPVSSHLQAGDAVATGEPIGVVATGGSCTECLHWGVRAGAGYYLDPLMLLAVRPVIRLYP